MQMLEPEQAFAENMADFKTHLTRYVFFAFLQVVLLSWKNLKFKTIATKASAFGKASADRLRH
jgi:hypothetical protein